MYIFPGVAGALCVQDNSHVIRIRYFLILKQIVPKYISLLSKQNSYISIIKNKCFIKTKKLGSFQKCK